MSTLLDAEDLDLAAYIRSGDTVVWGQACSEPLTLTRLLAEQASHIGVVRCFIGIPSDSATLSAPVSGLEAHSYCGTGTNSRLQASGDLEIWPVHYSRLPELLTVGALSVDVVLVQVSAPDASGRHSLGLGDDYVSAALDTARVVIAEVNEHVPFTLGARTITAAEWTAAVRGVRPPGELAPGNADATVAQVAANVAALVPDGATVQVGIGALPEAVLVALREHSDLGIHTGILGDRVADLIELGVANGSRKSRDAGVAIAGLLGGTAALFEWAHRNRAVELRSTRYTHDPEVLATSHALAAVNGAIEVDLGGSVNAERIGHRYVGAVGGAVDFLRGARRSPGGLPIVALPSTAGGSSRITVELGGPTSTPRSEDIIVVTEYGVADLRGLPLRARAERMIAIAHPDHRGELRARLPDAQHSTAR